LKFVEDLDELFKEFEVVVGVENSEDALSLKTFEWQKNKKTLIIFGQESSGIPREILDKCTSVVAIQQRGSVRSLNVAVAAGIVMNDYGQKTT